jgi:hypothetical protein
MEDSVTVDNGREDAVVLSFLEKATLFVHLHLKLGHVKGLCDILNLLHDGLEERPGGWHGSFCGGAHHGGMARVGHDGEGLVVDCDALLAPVQVGRPRIVEHLEDHQL